MPIVTTGAPVAAYGRVREFAGGALIVGALVVLTRIKGVDDGTEEVPTGRKQDFVGGADAELLGAVGYVAVAAAFRLRRHVHARWARQRAWTMISTKWLAFMTAGATTLATPAIAAAALPIRLTPSQIRLARTQAHLARTPVAR